MTPTADRYPTWADGCLMPLGKIQRVRFPSGGAGSRKKGKLNSDVYCHDLLRSQVMID